MSEPEQKLTYDQDPFNATTHHGLRELLARANRPNIEAAFGRWVPPGGEILEVGCGSGELYRLMPDYYRPGYKGVDEDRNMLDFNGQLHPEAELIEADIYSLPFETASQDAVVANNVFDVMTDLPKALREMRRVLKPGGAIIHFHDCRPSMGFLVRTVSRAYIPFPAIDADGGLRRFNLLAYSDYQRHETVDGMTDYVNRVRSEFDYLERMREENPDIVSALAMVVQDRYDGLLQPSPDFRQMFNQAIEASATQARLVPAVLTELKGQAYFEPSETEAILGLSHHLRFPYERGNIVHQSDHGQLRFSAIQHGEQSPDPLFVSSLGLAVLVKSRLSSA